MRKDRTVQRILITGANRGIGFGLVTACLKRGDRVFAGCRNPEKATGLNTLQQQYGEQLTVLPLDVTRQAAIDSAVAVVGGFVDGLDILVNNAGVGGDDDILGRLSANRILAVMKVNSAAPVMMAQSCLPLLRRGQRPVIAHITSRMGSIADNGSGGYYSYRASKAALNMLNKSLSIDLAREEIIAVVLHPGWVQTDMGGQAAPLSVDKSAAGLLQVISGLSQADSGRFYDFSGRELHW